MKNRSYFSLSGYLPLPFAALVRDVKFDSPCVDPYTPTRKIELVSPDSPIFRLVAVKFADDGRDGRFHIVSSLLLAPRRVPVAFPDDCIFNVGLCHCPVLGFPAIVGAVLILELGFTTFIPDIHRDEWYDFSRSHARHDGIAICPSGESMGGNGTREGRETRCYPAVPEGDILNAPVSAILITLPRKVAGHILALLKERDITIRVLPVYGGHIHPVMRLSFSRSSEKDSAHCTQRPRWGSYFFL